MITKFDYISIIFYFVFVVVVGVVFSRRNKNTSDYFRGGGIMPWWMAGVSAWMARTVCFPRLCLQLVPRL